MTSSSLQRNARRLVCAVIAALLHNGVHESVHYVAACLAGESVTAFRFLTAGWGTSQVFYATPVAERSGAHWLFIAWAPAVVTISIGYAIYTIRTRWWGRSRWLDGGLWYSGLLFLCLDPFYFGILSMFVGGDIDAVAAIGWPAWPVRLAALAVLAINVHLLARWWREAAAGKPVPPPTPCDEC